MTPWEQVKEDVNVAFDRDPAARSAAEVALTYPGVHAILVYRLSHWMWRHELKLVYSARFRNLTFSGVYIYGSGRPYTEPIGTEEVDVAFGGQDREFSIERVVVGDKNGARLPSYQRLDLSANLEFELFSGTGTLGLTVFNVGDHANVWYKEFSSVDGEIFENNILLMSRTYNLFFNVRF